MRTTGTLFCYVLHFLTSICYSWQFAESERSFQPPEWVNARAMFGSDFDYRGIERSMKFISPATLRLLRRYNCPLKNYINEVYIESTVQDSMIIGVDCNSHEYWLLYNGVISGHITLDEIFKYNPLNEYDLIWDAVKLMTCIAVDCVYKILSFVWVLERINMSKLNDSFGEEQVI